MTSRHAVLVSPVLLTLLGMTWAEDVVIVSADADRTKRLVGRIVELTGDHLVFEHPSGRKETVAGSRVIDVRSHWSPQLHKADTLFQQRRYAEALPAYRPALGAEERAWVKQRIRARVVWCNRYLGRTEQAGAAFRALYQRDPTTREFAAIPLDWITRLPSPGAAQRAKEWLAERDSGVARLIAASWLLSTSSRADALRTLNGLLTDSDPRVAFLAEAQQWRTRLTTTNAEELKRWTARVDRMPDSIRAGPIFVIATALARQQHHESAALEFMRIPILYPMQRRLSSRSLLAAAGELEKMDKTDEPRGLYREVILEYPGTDAAQQSQQKFERLK